MISILRIFSISLLLMLAGCRKAEFSIEFDLPKDVATNYKISYYASDKRGGMTVETVAPIVGGKASVKGRTVNPVILFISSSGGQTLPLYAERGETIKISGESANPFSWTVEGNDIDKAWCEWRRSHAEELNASDPAKTNSLIASFVEENPASPVAALMLLTSFSRKDNEPLFRRLWRSLSGEAADPRWAVLAGRADMPAGHIVTPGILRSIAVRSLHHGVDTLRTDSAKATLLFFWNSGLTSRRERIDSLKILTKEFPDSASRIIADICLEADSISWRTPLRYDSVSGAVRGWLPQGLADRRVMALDVRRTPFYIVAGPDGRQRYRGDDSAEAFSEFRRLMKKK